MTALTSPVDRSAVRQGEADGETERIQEAAGIAPDDRLRAGERLSLAEFDRRAAIGERAGVGLRAELIEGTVRVSAPPDLDRHAVPNADLQTVLVLYQLATPGVRRGANGVVRLSLDATAGVGPSLPNPDDMLFIDAGYGGQMARDDSGRRIGVPELIVEIANTSAVEDLTDKRDLYERIGVQEYLVYAVRDRRLVAFRRRSEDDRFRTVELDGGVFRSESFPGLHIDAAALAREDLPAMQATLQSGLQTPEHAAFAHTLADAKTSSDRADEAAQKS